jgi:methylenetetrahydrofolate reductase (NADPH)
MHISDVFARNAATFSFEFFPPKTEKGWETLFGHIQQLESLRPTFVSVTYGAGGSTREQTHNLVVRIKNETALMPIPHLTCVCHSEEEIAGILERYAEGGVKNILALGGDPPADVSGYDRSRDAFRYASDLVRFIRKFSDQHLPGKGFGIGVAGFPEGHPATPNRVKELDYLKAKVDAGADYICTQVFFNNGDFYDFSERCEAVDIDVPIIAGIMPITSHKMFKRLPDLALGARYPSKLLRRIMRCGENDAEIRRVGIDWATRQCYELLDHSVRGIHFYTLNQSTATIEIFRRLGAADSADLAQRAEEAGEFNI